MLSAPRFTQALGGQCYCQRASDLTRCRRQHSDALRWGSA